MMVVMALVAGGLEMDVGWQHHCPVWETVGDACHAAFVVFVMGALAVVVFVAELVEAFEAEAFHLVSCAFGGCFGFVDAGDDLGEDAAEDVFALGVWGVGRLGDGIDGVEGELVGVSLDVWFF